MEPSPAQSIILSLMKGRSIKLRQGESKSLIFGSDKRCDLKVRGKYASRVHASVEARRDGFYLVDASINGTFVLAVRADAVGGEANWIHLG